MAFVDAQRQNVAHLRFLVGSRFGQNVFVLLVQANVRLDLSNDQTDDRRVGNGGQCVKSCARRDVNVPGEWIIDWEPVLAECANLKWTKE